MEEYRFNTNGSDASYLASTNMFFSTLFGLTIFKEAWPEQKLGSQTTLEKGVDWYRQMFEGGLTGNRLHIAARKTARKDLDERIQKILQYLAVMAEQSDISMMLNSGVVVQKKRNRARRTPKPATGS